MLLEAGLGREDLDRIFIGNPARAFSFREVKS